jgi:hypothetical protein
LPSDISAVSLKLSLPDTFKLTENSDVAAKLPVRVNTLDDDIFDEALTVDDGEKLFVRLNDTVLASTFVFGITPVLLKRLLLNMARVTENSNVDIKLRVPENARDDDILGEALIVDDSEKLFVRLNDTVPPNTLVFDITPVLLKLLLPGIRELTENFNVDTRLPVRVNTSDADIFGEGLIVDDRENLLVRLNDAELLHTLVFDITPVLLKPLLADILELIENFNVATKLRVRENTRDDDILDEALIADESEKPLFVGLNDTVFVKPFDAHSR